MTKNTNTKAASKPATKNAAKATETPSEASPSFTGEQVANAVKDGVHEALASHKVILRKGKSINVNALNVKLNSLRGKSAQIKKDLLTDGHGKYLSGDLTGEEVFLPCDITKLAKLELIDKDEASALRIYARAIKALSDMML